MMQTDEERHEVRLQLRLGSKERVMVLSEARVRQLRGFAHAVWREPFSRRTWSELGYFVMSAAVGAVGFVFIVVTLGAGIGLSVTFFGLAILAASVRGARGIGRLQRTIARNLLGEDLEEPPPFTSRPGFLGWLQSTLRDRVGWRAIAYSALKVPLAIFGVWFALSVWIDAFFGLAYPVFGAGTGQLKGFGVVRNLFQPGYLSVTSSGFFHALFIFLTGVLLLCAGPVDDAGRRLARPPADAACSSGPTRSRRGCAPSSTPAPRRSTHRRRRLRRIERDLHDGTQAQLVALAMRLGQAKEKLARPGDVDLEQVRRLVNDAHRGAKEAIVELRDLARGIHPPVLDTGLEGALSTLAARSTVPTELTGHRRRPTDARPSRRSPTSASPSSWPTSPSTPRRRGRRWAAPSTVSGCASSCATTDAAGPSRPCSGPPRAGCAA